MAVVGNALMNKFLGHTTAETFFQPWWDTTEDFLVYALIMLGRFYCALDMDENATCLQ